MPITLTPRNRKVSTPVMVGSIVGAAATGGLLALLATWLFLRSRTSPGALGKGKNHDEQFNLTAGNASYYQDSSNQSSGHMGVGHSTNHTLGGYHIEPFTPPGEHARLTIQPTSSFDPQSPSTAHPSTDPSVTISDSTLSDQPPRYVDSFPAGSSSFSSWRHPRPRKGAAPAMGQSYSGS
jgi:hypothetical protein